MTRISPLYTDRTTHVGYSEYGRDASGDWYTRHYSVTRNGNFRRPTKWTPITPELNSLLSIAVCVSHDDEPLPPRRLKVSNLELYKVSTCAKS